VEPPARKEGFQMQEQFGTKDPEVKSLSFGPQILNLGPLKWTKSPGVKLLSLRQKTPE
jgi:hypothetical protein